MRALCGTAMVGVALLAATMAPSAASAATEFGNGCVNDDAENPNTTLVQTGYEGTGAGSPVAGVVTKWTINSGESVAISQKLKIARRAVGAKFTVVGESAVVSVAPGQNMFATRLPIAAGDLIGLATPQVDGGVLYCENQGAGDSVAFIPEKDQPVGSTEGPSAVLATWALPVRLTIEPDADRDGYGDESQDGCPGDASTQAACPPALAPPIPHPKARAVLHKGSVTVTVTSDVAGSASVAGKARLGKGKQARLRSGRKALVPGQKVPFTLKFTPKLKAKLAALPSSSKLKLTVTVTVTNAAGVAGVKTLPLKLPGRA